MPPAAFGRDAAADRTAVSEEREAGGGTKDGGVTDAPATTADATTAVDGCSSPIAEAWTHSLGTDGSGWTAIFGDPIVETGNTRLRLTYDDIVTHRGRFSRGYYVTHQLTLSGGTVFTPYVYIDNVLLPSIRRSGNDMQFGGDEYGAFWSDTEPAGFAGKRAVGALTGKVTTYVRSESKQMAMKVEAGGAVYRSGWTATFTWPDTDVGLLRLVGQNNSTFHVGGDDHVYVGPLTGCSNLSDADVVALYNR